MCLRSSYFLFLSLHSSCILCLINEHLSTNKKQILSFGEDSTDAVYHAFVQTGSELHYFKDISYQDSILLPIVTNKKQDFSHDFTNNKQKIKLFEEEMTDFGITTFGVLVHRIIYVTNPVNSKIVLSNIISSGINFHCSSSFEQNLMPKQRISFHIYFLPTSEEPPIKEEILSLFTSFGVCVHKVRGQVNGNFYRIKPLSNIRLPINSTFSTPIQLHNPHFTTLRLLEIFSSDCNIQLEFPTENLIKSKNNSLNSILMPFETRKIVTAKIIGNVERNTTSFIFIKYSLLERLNDEDGRRSFYKSKISLITIPVETQVTLRRDIFSTVNLLDFGFVKAGKQLLSPLKLSVFSTLERGVEIDSIYSDKSKKVYIQFETHPPISLKSAARGQPGLPVDIASINIDTFIDDKTTPIIKNNSKTKIGRIFKRQGNIMAVSRGGNFNVTVPFVAQIYEGGIEYNLNELSFHKNLKPFIRREIILTNTLPFSLAIFGAEIEENANVFEVFLIESPIIISSGQSLPSLIILFKSAVPSTFNFSSHIILNTNLTNFQLPLYIFHGELNITLHSIEQDIFNFGLLKSGENRSIVFELSNPNPIAIEVLKFNFPARFSKSILLYFIDFTNQTSEPQQIKRTFTYKNPSNFSIPSHSSALFKLILHFNSLHCDFKKSDPSDLFSIKTTFSSYQFPIYFELTNSTSLFSIPNKIVFNEAFVGGVYTKSLILLSTLPLQILRVLILNKDSRFFLSLANKTFVHKSQLKPWIAKNLANISFVPEASCPRDCYLGIPLNSPDGQWFSYGMKLPQNLAEIDHYLFSRLRRKWAALEGKKIQTTVKVDTDKIKGFEVPVEANLIWPKLFSHSTVHFPLTAFGNFSIVNLTITNPTTSPIIIQILPLVIYPDSDSLLDFLSDELALAPLINPIELNKTLMFSLRDTELFTLRPGSPTPKLREEVEKIIEGPVPRFTLTMLLRPGMSARVRIGFLPSDYSLRSSMMIIRNNLTVIEPVVLYGRGARINIGIDNKTAGSQPLLFELEPKHLDDCANPRRQLHRMPTTLTVRRSFAVHNNGEVGFSVVNISISGAPCENRGFRVLNCDKFRLEPNETAYIDISYTPDFLFSINEATLQIFMHMNGTPWSFNLAAVIPKHLLSMCHSALPRPPFEALMYQTCVLALMFCLICMISCAYLEGDRVVLCAYKQQFLQGQQKVVFNLNDETEQSKAAQVDIGVEVGDFYRREFRKISSDTGIFQRIFWHTLNFVLWVFSYVWPFLRREKSNNSATTMKIPQLPVAELEVDRTLISLTNIKNEQQNQQHPLNNKEVTIINRIKKKSFVDTTNIDKQNIQNISLNDEKRQRRTKLKEKHSLNNVSKDVSENEKEIQQNNKNNKTSNKTLNIKISNKENINVLKSETKVSDSRGKFLSVSSSSSGEAMTSASLNDSVLFNGNQQKHFNFVNKTRKEDRNTSTSEEELEQQKWKKSSNDEDNNSKNDVSNKYSETEETSAESEIPEWADEEEHEKRGIDEDFEQLAAQSASLFNTSKSDDNNDEDSKNNDDINDNKVEKIISKLTKEYRERLLRIYKGRSRIDLRELLTLPPDLSPNISRGDEKSLNCTNEAVPKVDNPPRRKSPGGDFRGKNNKIIEEKTTNYQSGFLFNIKDAVWKPLSEMDVLNPDWSNNKK